MEVQKAQMMVGIMGFEGSGKRSLMRWLSGQVPNFKGNEPLEVVFEYPDRRLEVVARATKAQKKTYQKFSFLLPGPTQKIQGQLVQLRNCDAFIAMVKAFGWDPSAEDPTQQLVRIGDEMLLSDLSVVEKRLLSLDTDRKKGKAVNERERSLLLKAKELLDEGRFLREERALQESPELKGYRFFTQRSLLSVFNTDGDIHIDLRGLPIVSDSIYLKLGLELELMELEEDDRREFVSLYGIEPNSKENFLMKVFDLLNLKTFFTFVSNEARAWSVPSHYNCLECAGAIHSDIKRGFIRAEVISFKDLERFSDLQGCKKAGALRLEGKEYMVADGDVITFRFNV